MNTKSKLKKIATLAKKTRSDRVIAAVAKLSPATRSTVSTITDEALERAIKVCVRFAENALRQAVAAFQDQSPNESTKQLELTGAGLDLVNNLAELISET